MTIPVLIQRNAGKPVTDAATSTSLARDYKHLDVVAQPQAVQDRIG